MITMKVPYRPASTPRGWTGASMIQCRWKGRGLWTTGRPAVLQEGGQGMNPGGPLPG